VAEDFDLTVSAVRGWVKQHEIDAGTRQDLTTDEREELARLLRENRPCAKTWSPKEGSTTVVR
jgi:transposase